MINKEKLLDISELNLAGKLEKMGDDEFNEYIKLLNKFTEDFPDQEEKINAALKEKDYNTLKKELSAVQDILEKIYADEKAQECAKQVGAIGGIMHEKIEAYMRYFLSSLSMLSIDIQMAEQNVKSSASLSMMNNMGSGHKIEKKILAVDDTAFFLTILKTTLQDTKYKLTCVTSGRDALKYLQNEEPDIFLLDIEMPGMDGYELAERIKADDHKAPIIFLTGNAKKEYLAKAMKAGAADFIIKPIQKDFLLAKISKYI